MEKTYFTTGDNKHYKFVVLIWYITVNKIPVAFFSVADEKVCQNLMKTEKFKNILNENFFYFLAPFCGQL